MAAGAAGTAPTADGRRDLALARYNPDGSLEATFGTGGEVLTRAPTYYAVRDP